MRELEVLEATEEVLGVLGPHAHLCKPGVRANTLRGGLHSEQVICDSTYDGLSIARSVIEYLHNDPRLGCKSLFATHYHELTELAATLPGVVNFSVAVAEEDGKVVFLHRIIPGGADRSYGVHVAQLAGLPRSVVNRAWEVLADLEQPDKPAQGKSRRRTAPAQQMSLFQPEQPLLEEVRSLDVANLTPLEAINKLYQLQEKAKELEENS